MSATPASPSGGFPATRPVLLAFAESGRFPRCERCHSPVPGDAWRWTIDAVRYCSVCVPLTAFTTPSRG